MLFTFIAEHDGVTLLEQVVSPSLDGAVRRWNTRSGRTRIPADRLEMDEPTPVEGLQRVWCFSGIDDDDKLYIVHVIETVSEVPS